jgi:signal transduction histidine kinase
VLWRTGTIRHHGRVLGEVAIALSRQASRDQLWQHVWIGLGVSLAAMVVGWASVGFLLRRLLRRPLDQLVAAAGAFERGRYDAPVAAERVRELAPVHVALAAMGAQIKAQVGQLQATNLELGARNAEMEQFTYSVSHDLKSPLVTISGYLGVLDEDLAAGRSADLAASLARIGAAVAKMSALLDDLLALSQLGRVANPSARVALGDVVRDALERVGGAIERRGVAVTVAPDLPEVTGDRVRLVEVIQNLVENAVKYLGAQPSPAIEIGTRPDATGAICFVRDNGIGVSPKHAERIFGLFEKLDPRSEGTGVGLALVKKIIEVHGGSIWVESDGATGSTFVFRLPAAPADRRPG